MSEEFHLIPTRSREKPEKSLSYPIGAEALSHALNGVPQYHALQCSFHSRYANHESMRENPLGFMTVGYARREAERFASQSEHDSGMFDASWLISIHGVPGELNSKIKQLLIDDALENIVRPWLMANAALEGKFGQAQITLHYDRQNNVIGSREYRRMPPERSS